MTEEQKVEECPYLDCKRMGLCSAAFYDALCYHERTARARALADARSRASQTPTGDRA